MLRVLSLCLLASLCSLSRAADKKYAAKIAPVQLDENVLLQSSRKTGSIQKSSSKSPCTSQSNTSARVLILGAGAAGIMAAQTLVDAGMHDFIILESEDVIGGRMKSIEFANKTLQLGANWVQGTEGSLLWDLVQKYDIACNMSAWDSWYTYDENGLVPWSRLKEKYKRFNKASRKLDKLGVKMSNSGTPDIDVEVALNLGGWQKKDIYDESIEYGSEDFEFAAPSRTVSLIENYPNEVYHDFKDEDCFVFDQRGWRYMLEAMVTDGGFESQIRPNTFVTEVEQAGQTVTVKTSAGQTYSADHVIVTFSMGVLKNSLDIFSPALPDWKTELVHKIDFNLYTKIFFSFPQQFWPDDEVQQHAGPTYGEYSLWQNLNHQKYLGQGPPYIYMVTVFDWMARKVEKQPKNQTIAEAMQVLKEMNGADPPEPLDVFIANWTNYPSFQGSYPNIPISMTYEDRVLLGSPWNKLWFAGDAYSLKYYGYVHGALETGQETATELLKCLNGRASCPDGSKPVVTSTPQKSLARKGPSAGRALNKRIERDLALMNGKENYVEPHAFKGS
eukprot:TRINITY_DN81182_c0_g1_i1.p1 TRINITY_DN81182_c0_g1~~TRINITY_DN81182_c0_g1_i1.p1  ORF type:complete len:559 (-),score=81.26 TRINITY_DN81182_c0_g1_i1:59-1735(-)